MSTHGVKVTEGTGPTVDTDELTVDGVVVQRQRITVAGTAADAIADVTNSPPSASAYGIAVRVVGSPPNGLNSYGSTVNVVAGATDTLVSLVAPVGYSLKGFTATGDGDGYFTIKIDGSPVMSGRTSAAQKSITLENDPAPVDSGAVVTVLVTNTATASCGYEGTILGVQSV